MTWRLRGALIIGAAIALGVAGYLVSRHRLSDEEKIIQTLVDATDAIERKDVRDTMAVISEEYHDAAGLTRRVLTIFAWRAREIEEGLRVVMSVPEVTLEDGRASAETEVTVYVIDASGRAQVLFEGPVNLTLRKERRGRWRVIDSEGWQDTIEVEQGF